VSVVSPPAELDGFLRADGRVGVRNHLLVLPSVVCSSHAAREIARGTTAVAVTHQHGCLHVGDDLRHTEHELLGTATNPNVGAVVVVSLGCETLRGARLAERIAERGQTVELVGIQSAGGTARAVEDGRAVLARLAARLDGAARQPVAIGRLVVGIDDAANELADPLREALHRRGIATTVAPAGLVGAEAHVTLAARGAQLIVGLPGPDDAPIGFAGCPVVAVGRDAPLHLALADDFDVHADRTTGEETVELVAERVLAHARGRQTASETRGSRDFVLQRLAMTM
jgi:altronate dehydratase